MVLTLETFLKICAGFTAVCIAGGWMIKIIKAAKKPADEVHDKLDTNGKKIKNLEEEIAFITDSIAMLMRCDLVMLAHMRTNNETGRIAEMEDEIQNFLIKR